MQTAPAASREQSLPWRLVVLLLVVLSVLGPMLFGLPVIGHLNGFDANFALDLTRGYTNALRAGQWFPRWLPAANAGMGSPVFYFYGRLPFLVAALLGVGLHLSPAKGLLAAFTVFRAFSFFSCRGWLRGTGLRTALDLRAADCGALFFAVSPYAMSLNPVTRLGLAETAATALLPLLFWQFDEMYFARRSLLRTIPTLALTYAALAWCHLPQLVLAVAVTSLYLLCRRSLDGLAANLLGFGLGVLLAAPSVLPALLLQGTISAQGWSNTPHLLLRNNFLFTRARLYFYGLYALDMELYATWLLCLLVLLVYLLNRRRPRNPEARLRGFALAATLAILLLAVTGLVRPLWLLLPSLQALQFPWRLFPGGLALSAALVTLWTGVASRRGYACLALCGCLVVVQLGVTALGAVISLTRLPLAFAHRPFVAYRLPVYVPAGQRELPAFARRRSFVPEYIPAGARRAGWQLSPTEDFLIPGPLVPSASTLAIGVHESMQADGSLHLTADLPTARRVLLPLFYYPDEATEGAPGVIPHPDPQTGLASVDLPRGPVTITVTHNAALAPVRWSHRAFVVGLLLLLACILLGRKPSRSAAT